MVKCKCFVYVIKLVKFEGNNNLYVNMHYLKNNVSKKLLINRIKDVWYILKGYRVFIEEVIFNKKLVVALRNYLNKYSGKS